MKKRKKIFLIAMIVVCLLLLVGCDNPFNKADKSNYGTVSTSISPSVIQLSEMPDILLSSTIQHPLANPGKYKSSRYIYSTRGDARKKAYDKILNSLFEHYDEDYRWVDFAEDNLRLICAVDLSDCNIGEEESAHILWDVINDNLEFFYIENSYSYRDGLNDVLYIMTKEEYASYEERKKVYAAVDENIKNVETLTANAKNDAEKAKIVAEYVKEHISYAEDYNNNPIVEMDTLNISGALKDGVAVCGGYSKAYSFLAEQVGLETIYVTGFVTEGYHAWNYVKVAEDWYLVDTTFSDGDGYPQWVLLGNQAMSSHIPDCLEASAEYSYTLPSLSQNDYILGNEDIEEDTGNNIEDNKKDDVSNSSADEEPSNSNSGNSSVSDSNKEDSNVSISTPDTNNQAWSDWVDVLPHFVSVNCKDYVVETATFYRYQYEDTKHTQAKSAELENNGYFLVETNNDVSAWSDYSTSEPIGGSGIEIEKKLQRRTINREYTESNQSTLSGGWTWYDSYSVDNGWSEWSSAYPEGQQNIESRETDDYNAPITKTYYQYSRYSVYGSDGKYHTGPTAASISYWGGSPKFTSTGWQESSIPYSKMSNANVPMYGDNWYNEEMKTEVVGYNKYTEYRYLSNSVINRFYKDTYGEWTDCSQSDSKEGETRVLYRYRSNNSVYVYRKLLDFTEWNKTPLNDNSWRNKEEKTMYRYKKS